MDKLRSILEMEEDYKSLDKSLIKKILIAIGEEAGLIPEEAFGRKNYHRAEEVAPCTGLF